MAVSSVILGKRLQAARNQKGYTQEYIAEKIDLTPEHVSRIENGKKDVYLRKLALWCDALDVPIEEMLSGAVMPVNPAHNRQFGGIAQGCSEETVTAMLSVCREIAEVEKRSRQHPED